MGISTGSATSTLIPMFRRRSAGDATTGKRNEHSQGRASTPPLIPWYRLMYVGFNLSFDSSPLSLPVAPFCLLHQPTLVRTTFSDSLPMPPANNTHASESRTSFPPHLLPRASLHACKPYAPVVTVASSHTLRPICHSDRLDHRHCHPFVRSFVHSPIHTILIHMCIHGSTSFLGHFLHNLPLSFNLGWPPRPVPQTPGRHTGPFGAADDRGAAVSPYTETPRA